jgi:hypothetical protein
MIGAYERPPTRSGFALVVTGVSRSNRPDLGFFAIGRGRSLHLCWRSAPTTTPRSRNEPGTSQPPRGFRLRPDGVGQDEVDELGGDDGDT